jgi:hypothetical protein
MRTRPAKRVSVKMLLDVPKIRVGGRVTRWLLLSANEAVGEVATAVTELRG